MPVYLRGQVVSCTVPCPISLAVPCPRKVQRETADFRSASLGMGQSYTEDRPKNGGGGRNRTGVRNSTANDLHRLVYGNSPSGI